MNNREQMPQHMAAAVHLSEMRTFALIEAERIRVMQDALVRHGIAKERDGGQLHNAEICEGIARLIDVIQLDPGLLDRLKKASQKVATA
jgi:hypothetical protein